ncbi:MAG: DUF4395 domain-containing protein [Halobacteriales archaeon]
MVDPRAPRFGQAVTAGGLLLGLGLQAPVFVYAIALVLNTALWTRWRFHPYSVVWRRAIAPRVGPAGELEPAAPHRFATLVGAVGTLLASLAFLFGAPAFAYILSGAIAAAAGLGATTGFCLGCRMYRSVSLFRRLNIV